MWDGSNSSILGGSGEDDENGCGLMPASSLVVATGGGGGAVPPTYSQLANSLFPPLSCPSITTRFPNRSIAEELSRSLNHFCSIPAAMLVLWFAWPASRGDIRRGGEGRCAGIDCLRVSQNSGSSATLSYCGGPAGTSAGEGNSFVAVVDPAPTPRRSRQHHGLQVPLTCPRPRIADPPTQPGQLSWEADRPLHH